MSSIMLVILTLVSTTVATVMAVLMWRMRVEERRRSEARVAALAADVLREDPAIDPSVTPQASAAAAQMFQPAERTGLRFAPAAAWVAVGLFAAAAFLLLVVGGKSGADARNAADAHRTSPAVALRGDPAPLELVALRHEREGELLTIRGVVRNPASGESLQHLTAVVLLLNADGDLITRERAAVAADSLPPGGETTFMVTVPKSGDAGRYRISFRTDDRVIPHVDRRT
jgi:hypothetical protein